MNVTLRVSGIVGLFLLWPTTPVAGGEIRILYWFDRGKPLDTFKFQAYDLRKNEFTSDVERWLSATRAKFPGYQVYTRDVDLSRERGETEKLKIGSAITREFLLLGNQHGDSFGAYPGTYSVPATRLRPLPRVGGPSASPLAPSAPFPVPVPYPKPHP